MLYLYLFISISFFVSLLPHMFISLSPFPRKPQGLFFFLFASLKKSSKGLFQSISAAYTLSIKRDYCSVCPCDECPIVRLYRMKLSIVCGCSEHTVSCLARHELPPWMDDDSLNTTQTTTPQLPNHVAMLVLPINYQRYTDLRLSQLDPEEYCLLGYGAV